MKKKLFILIMLCLGIGHVQAQIPDFGVSGHQIMYVGGSSSIGIYTHLSPSGQMGYYSYSARGGVRIDDVSQDANGISVSFTAVSAGSAGITVTRRGLSINQPELSKTVHITVLDPGSGTPAPNEKVEIQGLERVMTNRLCPYYIDSNISKERIIGWDVPEEFFEEVPERWLNSYGSDLLLRVKEKIGETKIQLNYYDFYGVKRTSSFDVSISSDEYKIIGPNIIAPGEEVIFKLAGPEIENIGDWDVQRVEALLQVEDYTLAELDGYRGAVKFSTALEGNYQIKLDALVDNSSIGDRFFIDIFVTADAEKIKETYVSSFDSLTIFGPMYIEANRSGWFRLSHEKREDFLPGMRVSSWSIKPDFPFVRLSPSGLDVKITQDSPNVSDSEVVMLTAHVINGDGVRSKISTRFALFSGTGARSVALDDAFSIKVFSLHSTRPLYEDNNIEFLDIYNTSLKQGLYVIEKTDSKGKVTREKVYKYNY